MQEQSRRKSYRTVNIPKPLYEFIKQFVESGKFPLGYVSADDFIRDTLRLRLRELGYNDELV